MVLHTVYNLLLIESYRDGDFNQVYPIARGPRPHVAVAAVLLVGESLAVAGGGTARRQRWPACARGRTAPRVKASRGLRLLTGLLIASYTVVDGIGVRRADPCPATPPGCSPATAC